MTGQGIYDDPNVQRLTDKISGHSSLWPDLLLKKTDN